MNWDALSAVGELIGAGAVVGTLLFLALQIRHGTRATEENSRILKATMHRNGDDSIARWGQSLAEDPALNELYMTGATGGDLDEKDGYRFFFLARNFLGIHAISFYEYDAVGDQESKRVTVENITKSLCQSPGLKATWEIVVSSTPFANYREFCAAVNDELAKTENT